MLQGWRKDQYARKPILGFGWAGIVASIVFCLLLIAHLSGFNLWHPILVVIHRVLGFDAVHFVVFNMTWYLFSLTDPVFGPAGALFVIVAFRIAPIRLGWWRYALVIGTGLAMPIVAIRLFTFFSENQNFTPSFIAPNGFPKLAIAMAMGQGVVGIIAAGALWLATRSKLVLAGFISSAMVAFARYWLGSLGSIDFSLHLSLNAPHMLFVIFTVGSTWAWAIRMRINWPRETACDTCGYDLRGLRDSVCPECGSEHGKQPAETPLTSP